MYRSPYIQFIASDKLLKVSIGVAGKLFQCLAILEGVYNDDTDGAVIRLGCLQEMNLHYAGQCDRYHMVLFCL